MDSGAAVIWAALLAIFLIVVGVSMYQNRHKDRRPSSGPGPAALGSIYDLLNQDKRNAIELIVEEKAEARDPEHADDTVEEERRRFKTRRDPR